MKDYIVIVSVDESNHVTKYQDFDSLAEANDHVTAYGGFVYTNPVSDNPMEWLVDVTNETVTLNVEGVILPTCKDSCCCQVEINWQSRINQGFVYEGNTFKMNDTSLSRIDSKGTRVQMASGELDEATRTFYDQEDNPVVFTTNAALGAFCVAFISERDRIDQKKIKLRKQVRACTTKSEVEAIDITTGW